MPLDLMPPCYQQVLTSHLEKREAAKVAGAKHKGNVGPAPALGWEELGEPDGRLYEQATGGAETPRGALGPPKLSLDQGAKKNFFSNKIHYK